MLAVSNKFRHNYRSSSKIGLLFMMLKLIWKRLKVIKKNFFKINDVRLFWNSQASVTGLKYLLQYCKICILLMLHGSDPHSIVSKITMYTSSQKRVSEIVLDNLRDGSWFQGNKGLGFIDRSTECRGSLWGVLLYAFQNNAGYLLSLTFPPLLEIPKIQDQLLGTEQYERREKSYSSTGEVTL